MEFLNQLPLWSLAVVIFLLRLIDVPLGTFRTISVVHGQIRLAVFLGFFEVIAWIVAISQVVTRIGQSPLLVVFYAGGFAAGNALGILLERRVSGGLSAVRIITTGDPGRLREAVAPHGRVLVTLRGEGPESPLSLLYVSAARRQVGHVLAAARQYDPDLFYLVDRAQDWSPNLQPVAGATGWRAIAKKK